MKYFNDVHILIYLAIGIAGFVMGKFVNWMNYRFLKEQKVISKDIFHKESDYKSGIIIPIFTSLIYIGLTYKFGIQKTFLGNLSLIKYLTLTPMIMSAFVIDYKEQIIPNRLNLTIFETALIFLFAAGIFNVNIAIDMCLGMLAGGGIFLLITIIGGLIAGKEAMGFGDVKLMVGLGLYFGLSNIVLVTLVSFLLGAIISIILLITKVRKTSEYIPFGPFIVLACFIIMFVPFKTLVSLLLAIFSLGLIRI